MPSLTVYFFICRSDNSPFAVFVNWFSALSIISKLLSEPNCTYNTHRAEKKMNKKIKSRTEKKIGKKASQNRKIQGRSSS